MKILLLSLVMGLGGVIPREVQDEYDRSHAAELWQEKQGELKSELENEPEMRKIRKLLSELKAKGYKIEVRRIP